MVPETLSSDERVGDGGERGKEVEKFKGKTILFLTLYIPKKNTYILGLLNR